MALNTPKEVRSKLDELGFVLIRSRKHLIYQHPETGTRVVMTRSDRESDRRACRNMRAILRREGFDV